MVLRTQDEADLTRGKVEGKCHTLRVLTTTKLQDIMFQSLIVHDKRSEVLACLINAKSCSLTVNDVSRCIQICSWCPGHHICYICSCLFNVLLLCEICGLQSGRRSGLGPAVQSIHLEALKVDWGPVSVAMTKSTSQKAFRKASAYYQSKMHRPPHSSSQSLGDEPFGIFCFFEVVPSPAKCQPHSIPFRSVFRSKILTPYTFAAVILIHTVLLLLRLLFKHQRGGTAGGTASQTWVDFEL